MFPLEGALGCFFERPLLLLALSYAIRLFFIPLPRLDGVVEADGTI